MKNNVVRAVVNALKGSLIGAANVIPGVSGGTIAVITRLYDDLIASISSFFRTGWKKNAIFLLPIVVGVAIGIILFARVIGFFLDNYEMQTVYFFMGLIGGSLPFLLPFPEKGSACKRLNLFLRWMVRKDRVDPGGWDGVPASKLIVPLDTHMYGITRGLGFTERKSADLRTAIEATAAFRKIAPRDPVRYDFALTRPGIRRDPEAGALLRRILRGRRAGGR